MNSAPAGKLHVVTGGAHAGKSEWAVARWRERSEVLFIACGTPQDARARTRLELLRQQRPTSWKTLELGPGDRSLTTLESTLLGFSQTGTLLLDGFNLWLAATLVDGRERYSLEQLPYHCEAQTNELLRVLRAQPRETMVVTAEASSGIAPGNPSGRLFRELLGLANQRLAANATTLHLVVAGHALSVKQG